MQIEDLKKIVGAALDRAAPKFELPTTRLESAAVNSISDDFLPGNLIRLSATSFGPEAADSITVLGTGVDLPFNGMSVQCRFYLVDGAAAFTLTATGNATWKLATSFPPFAGTLAEDLHFSANEPPKLFLETHQSEHGRPKGLTFKGVLDLGAMSFGLDTLLGQLHQPLSGPIVLKEKGSKFHSIDLVALISQTVDLKIAKVEELSFRIGSRLNFLKSKEKYEATPFIELAAAIPFSTQKIPISARVSARAKSLNTGFRFQADLSKAIDAGLDELKSLAQGHGMGDILPSSVQPSGVFKLNEFFFDFNPTLENKVTLIGMGVQSGPWQVLHVAETGKDLTVKDVQLTFVVGNPFGAAYKSLTISGEFKIGDAGTIEASMRYPSWVVQAYLKRGTTLKLQEAVAVFKRSTDRVPLMDVNEFELEVSPQGFSLNLELEGELLIPDTKFGLERAGVSIDTTSGSTFSFRGILLVGGAIVMLKANYPGAGEGWLFEGSTGPGQQIPIGSLIGDLGKKLVHIEVPAAINSLVVENVSATFETKTNKFAFGCDSKFRADDTDVNITVLLGIEQVNGVYSYKFAGTLLLGGRKFTLHFESGASNCFVATYRPEVSGQTLKVKQLVESVSSAVANYVPEGLEIQLKDVIFAYRKGTQQSTTAKFLFGMDIGTGIKISNLPVVGQLPQEATIGVDDLRILFNSEALSADDVKNFNSVIPQGVTKLPVQTPAAPVAIEKGFSLSALMNVAGSKHVLRLPDPDSKPRVSSGLMVQTKDIGATAGAAENVKWFVVQKTFGPVSLDKVGVQYQDATISFLLNAALSVAGLTLSFDGLSVGSKLSPFKPEPHLRGLGIEYKNDAVEIGGALMKTGDSYDGVAVIKTKQLTLSALGSYTTLENQPSLFIYAFVDYPLGGPAFFFVTGLAAGFGYNRRLIAPSIDKVSEFPLVKQAIDGRKGAPSGVMEALKSLRNDVPPSVGDIFLAIGVRFNSFKLVDSFALLTFEFGNRFIVNLLGISTAVVPRESGVTPLAQVQIAWKATYDPDEGCLAIDARLTPNSYILSKDCHLSGGYAFYSWFKGENAGDFVQTLGGYHPDFEKTMPAHYPKVPRLAFDWRVSNSLTIQGDAYYALTGSALMAGGHLEVLFRQGELRAWLKLEANFLIAWKPYQYKANVSVSVGASYTFDLNLLFTHIRVTISVNVGADLRLWGPDFSGTAHIDLSVISFTIAFGANASQEPKKIGEWSTFQDSFLPKENVCSISVQNGLIRKMKEAQAERWIINAKDFSLSVNCAIPFKTAFSQKDDKKDLVEHGATIDFGVRPMGVSPDNFKSTVKITVTRQNNPADGELRYTVIEKAVPKGLWDKEPDPNFDPESFLPRVPSGIEIRPANEVGAGASARIDLHVFEYSVEYYYQGNDESKKYAFNWERAGEFKATAGEIDARVENNPARAALLKDLGVTSKVKIRRNVVADDFMSAPQIGKLQN